MEIGMHFALKLLLSNIIILLCVWLGKRHPSLGGLIATMPLTSLLVLLWLYHDNPAARGQLTAYVGGVFFGVIPTLFSSAPPGFVCSVGCRCRPRWPRVLASGPRRRLSISFCSGRYP